MREDEVGVQGRRMGEAGLGERRWWVEVGWGGCRGGLLGRRGDEGGRGGGERVGGGEGEGLISLMFQQASQHVLTKIEQNNIQSKAIVHDFDQNSFGILG